MLRDYADTWSSNTGQQRGRDRRAAIGYLYVLPTVLAVIFAWWHVPLTTLTPYLTAMSVFTALLFGLLILVFNTAVTVRKDGASIANAHGLAAVVADLRATITYTIFIAISLVILLTIGASLMTPSDPSKPQSPLVLPWYWTPFYVWLALHLLVNVVKILERFRVAFNYISR